MEAAAEWYEARRPELGHEFVALVRSRIELICEAPERWRLVRGVRRMHVGRFPYAIVYRELTHGEIEIVAIAHLKRQPRYWSRR